MKSFRDSGKDAVDAVTAEHNEHLEALADGEWFMETLCRECQKHFEKVWRAQEEHTN